MNPVGYVPKDKDEKYPVALVYDNAGFATGETIVSAVVTVSPAGLTIEGSASVAAKRVSQTISGGTPGTSYILTFTATTSAGNVYEDSVQVDITLE